jgi:hypothetical protein
MSLVEELGVRVRAAADDLPLPAVVQAAEMLRRAAEIFSWVRVASERSGGVPEIWPATERLEHATAALRAARDDMLAYVAAIGLAPRPPAAAPARARRESSWVRRVDALTAHAPEEGATADADGAASSTELLNRVERLGGDRDGVRRELAAAGPKVGLGLATVAPKRIRELAHALLLRPPEPADLPRLTAACAGRVRDVLPGVDPGLARTVLARACHLPAPAGNAAGPQDGPGHAGPPHPVDTAVAGAVVAAALRDAGRLSDRGTDG